jgi:D-sedoheptulose 7-phosphate isomerase
MYSPTAKFIPPIGERLAVVHKLSMRGETIDEEAIWDGTEWTRCKTEEKLPLTYYYLWRRMESTIAPLIALVKAAKRVYIIGNGGSYANAVHMANDLLACGIKAYTMDSATLTASANDFGYETVFSRWIDTVGEAGDLLVAMSGSGKSPNILNAIGTAHMKEMIVYRIFGNERGEDMQTSEENQIKIGHDLMRALRAGV